MCMYCEIPLQSIVFHQNKPSFAKLPHGKPATKNRQCELTGPSTSPFAAHMLCAPLGAEPHLTIWLKGRGSFPWFPCCTHEKNSFQMPLCCSVALLSILLAGKLSSLHQEFLFHLLPPSSHIKRAHITQPGNSCFYPPGEELKLLVCIHFWMVLSKKIHCSYSRE